MNTIAQSYSIHSFSSSDMNQAETQKVIALIKDLYLWFAPGTSDEEIHGRLHQHQQASIDLLMDTSTGRCDGFTVYYVERFGTASVMFRGGTIIRHRSQGNYRRLLDHSVSQWQPDFIVAMTQNPRVYETLQSFSESRTIYPNEHQVPQLIQDIARHFCKVSSIRPESLIVPNVYESIRKDVEFKTARNPQIASMFANRLGVDDGFFVVVPVR